MRHVIGGVAGTLLTVVFAVTAGRGVGLTFRPSDGSGWADHLPGPGWLLVAGACLGLLVLTRRLSAAAPLTGAGLLLLGTLAGLLVPGLLAPGTDTGTGAGFGLYVLNGYGLGALFAGTLLVVAAVPAGRRRARVPEPRDDLDYEYLDG